MGNAAAAGGWTADGSAVGASSAADRAPVGGRGSRQERIVSRLATARRPARVWLFISFAGIGIGIGIGVVLAVLSAWPLRSNDAATASGDALPPRTLPGWHRVFVDNFTEPSLAATHSWQTYSGHPGGDPAGWWDPTHVVISHGELQILGYQDDRDVGAGERPGTWVTGGLQSLRTQTFGMDLVRFRMGRGRGIGAAILLWPANNRWPPEIDFTEDNGAGSRNRTYATLHYGSQDHTVGRSIAVDLTRWHTVGVKWTPEHLVFLLDGRAWATIDGPRVPAQPMRLALQTGENACGDSFEVCPDGSTPAHVDLDVQWVAIYAPTAGGAPSSHGRRLSEASGAGIGRLWSGPDWVTGAAG